MATTTNFGWETPDDTDLVKDGAAAMRTLGNAIDTSMVDLKGGTTGQVLSKASNTDMDFTWINNDQGDITGVTAGTGLTGGGTSGAVTLDFDVANYGGGQWAAGKNKIINGDFGINQRAFTSNTTTGLFNFDRWFQSNSGGTFTVTPQTFTLGAAPVAGYEGKTFLQGVVATQSAASDYAWFGQKIESVRSFAGQTTTISFWAKAGSGTPKIAVELAQNFGTGGSPSTAVNTYAGQVTLSTSLARYSVSVAVPSISGKTLGTAGDDHLRLNLMLSAGTDYNARSGSLGVQNNTFGIWGVQIEVGSTATPFQTATGTIQGELAACQRYYQQFGGGLSGNWDNTTTAIFFAQYPVQMRVAPTLALLTTSPIVGVQGGSDLTGSSSAIAFSSIGKSGFRVGVNGFTGATQYRSNWVSTQSTDILSGSAEL